MNLIDKYVSEVGRHLPPKMRTDIEAEIRSALEDMLDGHSKTTGHLVDDEMVFEVLKEYGNPEKVAASYLPERYLIGPSLYPIFLTLAKVILWVTGILALVGLGISLAQSATNFQAILELFVKAFTNFYFSAVIALTSVVFILGIIEWASYRAGEKLDVKGLAPIRKWDPHSLIKISLPNRIKLGETIAELVFTFVAILLFNFYPQAFRLGVSSGGAWYVGVGNWTSSPILSEAFFRFVPVLTVFWSLTILLDIVLLLQGYWNTLTRALSIGLRVIPIAIAAAMLSGPSLIALTASSFPPGALDAATVHNILNLMPQIVHILLWLTIFAGSVDLLSRLVVLIKNLNPSS